MIEWEHTPDDNPRYPIEFEPFKLFKLFKSVSVVGIQITRGRSVSWLKITPDNDVNCFAATFVKTESRPWEKETW